MEIEELENMEDDYNSPFQKKLKQVRDAIAKKPEFFRDPANHEIAIQRIEAGVKSGRLSTLFLQAFKQVLNEEFESLSEEEKEAEYKRSLNSRIDKMFKDFGNKFTDKSNSNYGDKLMEMAREDNTNIRVKDASEKYSTKSYVAKHAKYETPVHAIKDGVVDASPIETPSELEYARIGAFYKRKLSKENLTTLNEHDKEILNDMFSTETFIGWTPDKQFHRTKNFKSLINDSTSGGEYLVPEFYDTRLVTFPLLHSELLPFVDVITVNRGSSIETASVGNPTVTWGTAEGTTQSAFDTTDLVNQITASVFPAFVNFEIGRDLMSDSLPVIGKTIMANMGERIASELDRIIASGNGTTEPQGIDAASGTVDVTPANPTTGAVTVDDLLDLMFGVAKQYRTPSNAPRYVMTDARYRSHRALATGVSGDDRLLHGMSVQSYMLLESPVSIENSELTNSDGIFGALRKYRLWRRAGFETGIESGGKALTQSNTSLIWGRGRYAGKVVDGNAFALIDSWSASA